MFSFHKPKIYRSVNGCCICKAKSSSSRFTDSKKYEPEFEKCFRITEKRSGEICNACVLLVKRWKKLPPGTNRDWHHVVDARAGPGTKSVNKVKAKTAKLPRLVKKHKARQFVCKPVREKLTPGGLSDDVTVGDDSLSESSNLSLPRSRVPSPAPSDTSENSSIAEAEEVEDEAQQAKRLGRKRRRKETDLFGSSAKRHKSSSAVLKISSFLDMTFWRKEKICCGIIFKGPNNEVLIYPKLLRPCSCRKSSGSRATSSSSGRNDVFAGKVCSGSHSLSQVNGNGDVAILNGQGGI